jgi:hydroxymethylglutaryl-CoA lyase
MKKSATVVEVGLRDGLQNEAVFLSIPDRIEFANRLINAGLPRVELGAFVRKDKVPQMVGTHQIVDEVLNQKHDKKFQAVVLVPNEEGMQEALKTDIREVAVFAATSETFSRKNINCTIEESFERFKPVIQLAKKRKIKVRGYLSTCFGCPYEGAVPEKTVIAVAKRLYAMGCYEISIGDTIGVATPIQVQSLFKKLKKVIPIKSLAGHFHDTRGMASANIFAAYEVGVRVFDSSLGGLGGCPYAPGSSGNVATEDLVYLLHGLGIQTGIDLEQLIEINKWLAEKMGKELPSKVSKAGILKPSQPSQAPEPAARFLLKNK